VVHKFDLRILNWFLIEKMAFGRQCLLGSGRFLCAAGSLFGRTFQEKFGKRTPDPGSSRPRDLTLSGGKMIVFSRSFIRKRVISLATTASVAATSLALAHAPTKAYHVRGTMPIQYVADRPDYSGEQPFLSENDAVMNKMMADLTVKPTGDVDRDFVAMMVPHHQGAIDMAAKAELRYGRNAQLRRLAQEIVVTQQQEISAMQLALRNRLPASVASPAKPALAFNPSAMSNDAMGMSHDAIAHP
jgi:Domain of unknown function (DUF305)